MQYPTRKTSKQMQFLLYIAIPFIVYLLLPIIFMIQMWFSNTTSLGKWLIESLLFGLYMFDLFLTGVWPLTYGYLIRYVLIIIFIIVAIKSFFNVEKVFYFKIPNIKQIMLNLVYLCVICFFSIRITLAFLGSACPKSSIDMEFPLKGKSFYVIHGGSNQIINHHFPVSAQKYAMDITGVNAYGFRARTFFPNRLEDFFIYDTTVYSPCDGIVVEVVDEYKDLVPRERDPSHPAGNYLAIKKNESAVVVILAHLMKGTLTVKKGELIKKGHPVAKVGNSGNTTEPHLHIHAVVQEEEEDFLFTGTGVPITFKKKFLVRNDKLQF